MVDVITASCGSVDCPRAFECARNIVNGQPGVSYHTTDFYHTGWAIANSVDGVTSEGWDCGEKGNWALFFKLLDPNEPNCCPFCKNTDIRYSIKSSNDYRYYAAFYCNNCHCYGPRILSDVYVKYKTRHDVKKDENLKKKALDAWNKRK